MDKTISVVIPTFNRARTILRAVQSVLAQRDATFEILIVDDGSRDETEKLFETLSKEKSEVRYFYQTNQGPSAARNFGIQHSGSPYVAFLDSDDEWLPGKLKAQLDFFKRHPNLLICQTEELWIRNGKRVNPMKKHKKFGGSIFEKCLPLSIVSPSCVMMKRGFFDEAGRFDETLPACEDYDLWIRAAARFPIGLIEKPYAVKYGGHADQRSHQFPVMDQFRIRSLFNLLRTGNLNPAQQEAAASELLRKCKIVQNGAMKRGKVKEARFYDDMVQEVEELFVTK